MTQDLMLNLTETESNETVARAVTFLHYMNITMDILQVLVMLLLILIDISLILVFIKSKQLLKSPMHKYILLFLIANFLFVMFYPVSSGYIIDVRPFWQTHVYCSAYQVQHSFLFQMIIFGACPGFEWYLMYHKTNWHQKLKNNYSKVAWMLSLVILVHFFVNWGMCFKTCVFKDYGIVVTFAIALVLLIVLCCFKYGTKENKEALDNAYYLNISIYIILPWIPNFIFSFLFYFFFDFSLFYRFIVEMNVVTDFTAYSTPITVLYFLRKQNPQFRWELKNLFKKDTCATFVTFEN